MNRYATLDQALLELSQSDSIDTSADDTKKVLWHALGFVSERIEQMTADEFAPRIETRYFNARGRHIMSASTMDVVAGQTKSLHSPLGEITTLTLDGSIINAANYQADPKGLTPIRRITFTSGDSWLTYATAWRAVHSIAGAWVNRKHYSTEGWRDSGDVVKNNPLAANGTSITVNDADALTGAYALPCFQAGQLLRIGASGTDFRTVESVDKNTNALSVLCNANGSTSIQQAQDTKIYIWQPEPVIQRATLKWAQALFAKRGKTVSSTYDNVSGVTTTDFPPDAPEEVLRILVDGGYLPKECLSGRPK